MLGLDTAGLDAAVRDHDAVAARRDELEDAVVQGTVTPTNAAAEILRLAAEVRAYESEVATGVSATFPQVAMVMDGALVSAEADPRVPATMVACLRAAARTLQFVPDGESVVRVPITFVTRD